MCRAPLYESPVLRAVTGPVIRPGGFGLTDRGVARCRLPEGARVLDIGCGAGAVADYLRRCHGLAAMGLDLSFALLKEGAQTYGDMPLVQGRVEQLPVISASVDLVMCECVLSLCAGSKDVLGEVWRVLRPGGSLVLTDVYLREPGADISADRKFGLCCLEGAVDRQTVEHRIAAAGLDQVLWEDHTPLLNQLAAQLVWTYGSWNAFWSAVAGLDVSETMNRDGAGGCRRPGYYLLVAYKPGLK